MCVYQLQLPRYKCTSVEEMCARGSPDSESVISESREKAAGGVPRPDWCNWKPDGVWSTHRSEIHILLCRLQTAAHFEFKLTAYVHVYVIMKMTIDVYM